MFLTSASGLLFAFTPLCPRQSHQLRGWCVSSASTMSSRNPLKSRSTSARSGVLGRLRPSHRQFRDTPLPTRRWHCDHAVAVM